MGIWTTFFSYEEGSDCEIANENGNGNETCCSCDDQGNRNGTCTKIITQMEMLFKTLAIISLTSYCAYNVGNGNQTLIEICNDINVKLYLAYPL
jgi:hypothetical protein